MNLRDLPLSHTNIMVNIEQFTVSEDSKHSSTTAVRKVRNFVSILQCLLKQFQIEHSHCKVLIGRQLLYEAVTFE